MDIQYEKTGAVTAKLSVTVDAQEVNQAFKRAYKEIASQVRVPGFRPGKAPRHVIDMRYGGQIRSDVEQALIEGTLFRAISEKEVKVVATSHIHRDTPKQGKDWTYTAEVETQPEVKIQSFKGLYAPKLKMEVEEVSIDDEIEKMRQQMLQLVPVTDRNDVQAGDLVVIDHDATENGEALAGGKAEGAIVEVGAKDGYIPGLGDKLVGHKVPSEANVEISFAEDYELASWRGKTADFKVSLKEIKRRDVPEVDDELAKDLGEDSLKALRSKISGDLMVDIEKEAKGNQKEEILKSLVEANPFEIPPSMVRDQAERMVKDAVDRVAQMMGPGFTPDGLDLDALRTQNMERAEHQVRSGLLMLELTEQEGFAASDEEIDARIESLAVEAGEMAPRVKAAYAEPQARSSLSYQMLEDKAIEFLLGHAKLSDKAPVRKKAAPAKSEPKKEAAAKKAPAKKEAAAKKAPAKKEAAAKKTPAKKEAAAKKATKKAPAKKAAAKKTTKKAPAKKAAAKKTTKKTPAKKAASKKTVAKKTTKKTAAKKATSKKTVAKKTTKKAAAKKTTKKAATKKTAAKKTSKKTKSKK